jgi:DNA primase large subunit
MLNELFKKQKIAIRLLSNAKYNAHTEPLFKTLDIMPLPSLIQFFQLQFMQHFQQRFLPVIFSDAWIYNSVREIGENSIVLRNMDQLRVPFARISLVEKLPLVSFPTIWENFPDENIKFLRNKDEFNKKLKTYLLKKLSYVINCTRLYCPSCSG